MIVDSSTAAELLTVSVNVLIVLVEFVVKDAVTPFGKPKAANETF